MLIAVLARTGTPVLNGSRSRPSPGLNLPPLNRRFRRRATRVVVLLLFEITGHGHGQPGSIRPPRATARSRLGCHCDAACGGRRGRCRRFAELADRPRRIPRHGPSHVLQRGAELSANSDRAHARRPHRRRHRRARHSMGRRDVCRQRCHRAQQQAPAQSGGDQGPVGRLFSARLSAPVVGDDVAQIHQRPDVGARARTS